MTAEWIRVTVREALDKFPRVAEKSEDKYVGEAFRHGSLRIVLYAPRICDHQTPHDQDEVYVVLKGSGTFVVDDKSKLFAEGDVLVVPAGIRHRFEDFTNDLLAWVIFYGPTGGENPKPE